MLVVTHEMQFAQDIATRVWVIDRGTIAEDGPPARVVEAPESQVAKDFFGQLREDDRDHGRAAASGRDGRRRDRRGLRGGGVRRQAGTFGGHRARRWAAHDFARHGRLSCVRTAGGLDLAAALAARPGDRDVGTELHRDGGSLRDRRAEGERSGELRRSPAPDRAGRPRISRGDRERRGAPSSLRSGSRPTTLAGCRASVEADRWRSEIRTTTTSIGTLTHLRGRLPSSRCSLPRLTGGAVQPPLLMRSSRTRRTEAAVFGVVGWRSAPG